MELTEFLEGARICPDERLDGEYGLYANFTLLMNSDFFKFLEILKSRRNYEVGAIFQFNAHKLCSECPILYHPDTAVKPVKLDFHDWVGEAETTWAMCADDRGIAERERQFRDYNISIRFHHRSGRVIFMALDDLAQVLREQKIPACTPYVGKNHARPLDFSRVVYFAP